MKIKRFLAKNMREAIRLVREEQGPDAVILSSRRAGNEVEVVAAVDYDAALMQQAQRQEQRDEARDEAPERPAIQTMQSMQSMQTIQAPTVKIADTPVTPVIAEAANAAVDNQAIGQLREDLSGMRRLIEQQLAGLVWNDLKQRRPERVSALNVLTDIGLEAALAREIAGEMQDSPANAPRASFLPVGLLSRRLPIVANDPVLEGGAIALVGPTGVGKTTTLAKLAGHFAMHHGTRDIALVTTDHYRIGAQEQLFTYGRLLGIPVHSASNAGELADILKRLSDRRLVLIDTAGMGPRDRNLAAQFSELQGVSSKIRTFLVLAANCQASDLQEATRRFSATPLSGCIFTKVDECMRIGGALSAVIRSNLPLAYLCDGQRVPEDLQPARAERVVLRAMQLLRQHPSVIDDGTMALRFAHLHGGANYAAQ